MTGAGVDDLRARLDASRAALLRALAGTTEREFAAELEDGKSVVRVLAELAAAERDAVARAGGPPASGRMAEKPLPPQVVHDLAGARYGTQALVAAAADDDRVREVVESIVAREEAVAARIAARARSR